MRQFTKAAAAATSLALLVGVSSAASAATPARSAPKVPGGGSGSGITQQVIASGTSTEPYVRTPALALTNDGTLIAAYDPRPSSSDLPSNMSLVIQRSNNDGKTWASPITVRSAPAPDGFSDPSLLVDRTTGRIFLFYAASVNEGFGGSGTGNSPTDPNILQTDMSYSDNDGTTWTNEVITPEIKNPAWNGIFAASGEGIQLTSGPYAGRLVQQYVVEYDGGEYAASAYSDDNGNTWQMGNLVGPGMNENKTVQLANSNLLLDVRDAPERLIGYSDDGGVTYSSPQPNADLTDPDDNGSVIRYDPSAPAGSPEANWLLESNNDNPTERENLVVKLSCDDGHTWTDTKVIDPGPAGYSTLTNLPGGRFGLLYEGDNYTQMVYATFSSRWLDPTCASVGPSGAPNIVTPGHTHTIGVTVANTGTSTLPPGQVAFQEPTGWTIQNLAVPALQAGESLTAQVPVSVSADAQGGPVEIAAEYQNGQGSTSSVVPVTVLAGPPAWSTSSPVTTDGVNAVDESASLPAVSSLSDGTIAVEFRTTQSTPAGVLLSAANTSSNDEDLIVSINSGYPYVEVRTGASTYAVRLESPYLANDGRLHVVSVTTSDGQTVLGVDGVPVATSTTPGYFSTVSGLTNLTLGANVAETGTRWQFAGIIDRVVVTGSDS